MSKLDKLIEALKDLSPEDIKTLLTRLDKKPAGPVFVPGQLVEASDDGFKTYTLAQLAHCKSGDVYPYKCLLPGYPQAGIVGFKEIRVIEKPPLTWFKYEGHKPEWLNDYDYVAISRHNCIGKYGIIKAKDLARLTGAHIQEFALFERAEEVRHA